MKRRDFLASSAGTAAYAFGPGAGVLAVARTAGAEAQAATRLNKATFSALLNERFALRRRVPGAALVLVEVRASARMSGAPLEQFSLVFARPDGRMLEAGTYAIAHPQIGRFALYLEPAGDSPQGPASRADFSLIV